MAEACTSCGSPVGSGAAVCDTCGAPVATSAEPTPEIGSGETLRTRLQDALDERFELGARLGSGGFAHVYQARDTRLGREVAVKVLRPELAQDPKVLERFYREAQTVAMLDHPNLIPIHDVEQAGGYAWFIMPLVRGESLRKRLEAGPVEPEDARRILIQVAEGLHAAHESGVVHRDLKPENVMLTDGRVILMDFGIAKAIETAEPALTGAQQVMGTLHYMSPEQTSGDELDARSDIYSLGCLGYELLTGRPPFEAKTSTALAVQHLSSNPKPIGGEVPADLGAAVMRCLEKNPDQRWSSALELRNAVSPIRERVGPDSRLLLITAALSGAAFILSLADWGSAQFSVAHLVLVLPFVVALLGGRSKSGVRRSPSQANRFALPGSFEAGLYGGVVGGTGAGLVVGVGYVVGLHATPVGARLLLVAQTLLFGGFSGAILGATIQIGASWFSFLHRIHGLSGVVYNSATGGALGGLVGGLPVGVVLGLVFIRKPLPAVEGDLLFYGSTPIALLLVLAVLFNEQRSERHQLIVSLLGAGVITVFIAVVLFAFFPYGWVVETFFYGEPTAVRASLGGLLVGLPIGFMLGVQAGATIFLSRIWRSASRDS